MLDIKTVLELMRKYGYSSTSVHPFVYQKENTLGICYSYIDENYGFIERVKFFDNTDMLEEFLRRLNFVQNNGKKYNIRMILDNYEVVNPKILFLRNEKVMVKGEMFDIEGYDARLKEQERLDELSRTLLQAGNLLLMYDDLKSRQLEYYSSVIRLNNEVRQKYFNLQKMVDEYNNVEINRALIEVPNIEDTKGVNILLETSAKDRYNQYKVNPPTLEEARTFVKDIWDLNAGLETNINFYQAMVEEHKIRNEERIVNAKLKYMKELKSKGNTFFKEDLIKNFRRINEECMRDSVQLANTFIQDKIADINKKYAYYNYLDFFKLADYLKEATQNTNYGDIALKYSKNGNRLVDVKLPINEIATNLTVQYSKLLTPQEQAILVLYNSSIYRKFINLILDIENFENKEIKEIISILSKVHKFSKIKTECYNLVRDRIDLPGNESLRKSVFALIDFTTYENFVTSLVNQIKLLRHINNKMVLNSDINMYFKLDSVDDIKKKYFILITRDLNSLINSNDNKKMIAITHLRRYTPVLYSPYTVDFGNLYSKDSKEIKLVAKTDFELLIDVNDIYVNMDDNLTYVAKYYSEPKMVGNVAIVDDIHLDKEIKYCKLALINNVKSNQQSVDKSNNQNNGQSVQAKG